MAGSPRCSARYTRGNARRLAEPADGDGLADAGAARALAPSRAAVGARKMLRAVAVASLRGEHGVHAVLDRVEILALAAGPAGLCGSRRGDAGEGNLDVMTTEAPSMPLLPRRTPLSRT